MLALQRCQQQAAIARQSALYLPHATWYTSDPSPFPTRTSSSHLLNSRHQVLRSSTPPPHRLFCTSNISASIQVAYVDSNCSRSANTSNTHRPHPMVFLDLEYLPPSVCASSAYANRSLKRQTSGPPSSTHMYSTSVFLYTFNVSTLATSLCQCCS